jgi:hypothetical protein
VRLTHMGTPGLMFNPATSSLNRLSWWASIPPATARRMAGWKTLRNSFCSAGL